MEIEQKHTDEGNRCVHPDNTVTTKVRQRLNNRGKNVLDKHLNSVMKERTRINKPMYMNANSAKMNSGKDDLISSVNLSSDNSKIESDFSDFDENNTRCQLVNDSFRAKLLGSVSKPLNGSESKLRVSVFDHKLIRNKFITTKKMNSNLTAGLLNGNNNDSGPEFNNTRPNTLRNMNKLDNNHKKSGMSHSKTIINKRCDANIGNTMPSPTSPNIDNDERTRFDILLRNLIGDVNELETTPVIVSSGYESDYTQNRSEKHQSVCNIKRNDCEANVTKQSFGDAPSENINPVNVSSSLQASHEFSSLPSFPTQITESSSSLRRHETQGEPQMKLAEWQRHNFKLTKVSRSMYEIIHDLECCEKSNGRTDNRKRPKKEQRTSHDNSGRDRNSAIKEVRPAGRLHFCSTLTSNKAGPSVAKKDDHLNQSSISGAVLRCVRRPLGIDSQSMQQNLCIGEKSHKLTTTSAAVRNSSKVENDLRNLLCGTSTVNTSSTNNSDANGLPSNTSALERFSSAMHGRDNSGLNNTNVSINCENNINDTDERRPTLLEQFMKRSRPEDHVYETIPGDEKLYEEWKRLRDNPNIQKIRRFTTVPDLPGTFVPKEPPALPERNYIVSAQFQSKESGNCILMGDVNFNFLTKPYYISEPLDSLFVPVSPNSIFDSKMFACYPYPLSNEAVSNHVGRNDETSDGYCSIDNLSLLRENLTEILSENPSRDWKMQHRNYFFSPILDRAHIECEQSDRILNGAATPASERHLLLNVNDVDTVFAPETKTPVLHATYV